MTLTDHGSSAPPCAGLLATAAKLPDMVLREATAVLALLAGLPDRTPEPAARTLAELFSGRRLEQAVRILIRWADARLPGRESR